MTEACRRLGVLRRGARREKGAARSPEACTGTDASLASSQAEPSGRPQPQHYREQGQSPGADPKGRGEVGGPTAAVQDHREAWGRLLERHQKGVNERAGLRSRQWYHREPCEGPRAALQTV